MKATLGCLGMILGYIVAVILNGWALSIMWGWFIVPTLGLPELGIVPALGVSMIVNFLTAKYQKTERDGAKQELANSLIFSILYPLLALGMGYILHLFMPA